MVIFCILKNKTIYLIRVKWKKTELEHFIEFQNWLLKTYDAHNTYVQIVEIYQSSSISWKRDNENDRLTLARLAPRTKLYTLLWTYNTPNAISFCSFSRYVHDTIVRPAVVQPVVDTKLMRTRSRRIAAPPRIIRQYIIISRILSARVSWAPYAC